MELKSQSTHEVFSLFTSSNRTFMELKYMGEAEGGIAGGSNRTFMELK